MLASAGSYALESFPIRVRAFKQCAGEVLFRSAGAYHSPTFPTAHAVGCILTPLRGYDLQGSSGCREIYVLDWRCGS